ncbi:mRNA splicing factor, Cwf18 [Ascosphaera apis ARSEF 7405]|uniref:mRNA splicing factor, Cwf18 n=1 Tax=Ascosphaera apis ARSEF 7405 TaxID=392613 RepID=A0A168D0V8_9EURO|nr:mRNA splicing factor, Cwf18 [Ascosphaera apis ARSEF 7405]
MMSSSHSLEAAAADRKTRLARLAALKRKPTAATEEQDQEAPADITSGTHDESKPEEEVSEARAKYLSGRNYDFETETVKLGFEHDPRADAETLENRARELAKEAEEQARKEKEEAAPIDLFQLQPKNPNWDLKRDLNEKLKILNVRTENAIARLVRERIQANQKTTSAGDDDAAVRDGQTMGMEGIALAESVRQREEEGAEDDQIED